MSDEKALLGAPKPLQGRGLRVIIVDDNKAHRFIIKEMLNANGFQTVAEPQDLASTLKAYRRHRPDAVILDLSLTQEDGLTILKCLRELDGESKVVIVSANTQKAIRDQCLSLGAAGYVLKPFEAAALIAFLRQAVAANGAGLL